jgi:regulator of protease activity HflC (stomatin/prohibitin superfamily)
MESALAWIGHIASWIGQWIPRWIIVTTTHGAVKFVRGHTVVTCAPGVHWYWPVLTMFLVHPIARQTANLRSQTVMTSDERTIAVGGMIVYEIADIEKIIAHTFDPDETIKDIAVSSVHDVCCQLSWAEIREYQRNGQLDTKLKKEARRDLERYGVRVLKMTLTDLAQCRVLKVINSTSQDAS